MLSCQQLYCQLARKLINYFAERQHEPVISIIISTEK